MRKENSPDHLSWRGTWRWSLFIGYHHFEFLPVESSDDGSEVTMFVQWEHFTGLLPPLLIREWLPHGKSIKTGFEKVNRDFKAWVEEKMNAGREE